MNKYHLLYENITVSSKMSTKDLELLCLEGDLEKAQQLLITIPKATYHDIIVSADNGTITREYRQKWDELDDIFEVCCLNEKFRVAEWILEIQPDINNHYMIQYLLLECNGNLNVLKWLFNLDNFETCNYKIDKIFERCCINNKLESAKWLLDKYQDMDEKILALSFKKCCYDGYIDIIKWFLEIKPEIVDIIDKDEIFCISIQYSNIDFVKFMVDIIPGFDAHAYNNHYFVYNCISYNEITEWLIDYVMHDNTRFLFRGFGYIINPDYPIKNWQKIIINDIEIYSEKQPDIEMLTEYLGKIIKPKSANSKIMGIN